MSTYTYINAISVTNNVPTVQNVTTIAGGVLYSSDPTQYPSFVPMSTIIAARSQSSASRSLNTIFQVSATRDSMVNYSVDIGCSITLTTGQSGTVYLEIASNSAFTANVQQVSESWNTNTGTLTIGLALAQNITSVLSGFIPAGYYARLRTANNTGTPTFTYRVGQEVLL